MDPTKPILDIYSHNYHKQKSNKSNINIQQTYPHDSSKSNTNFGKSVVNRKSMAQPSYSQLKDKYQELYQAYHEKAQRLNQQESEIQQYRTQVFELRKQLDSAKERNQELQEAMMGKNIELQDCYRKLQQQMRSGSRMHTNQRSIDKLEDGLKEAITSNFQLLKQSTLSQLRQYIPS